MLHGPKQIEDDLIAYISERITGISQESSPMIESDILHKLEEAVADNTLVNKVALPLVQTLSIKKENLSLLQLACKHGWEKLVDKLIVQAKERTIAIDFQEKDALGRTASALASLNTHESIAKKLASLPAPSFILPSEEIPDLGFKKPVHAKKRNRTEHDLIISAMTLRTADLAILLEQVNKLGTAKDCELPPLPPVEYGCAQGGGAKGAAYTGTVLAMDETGTLARLKVVAGASAGAINAFMIGLGLDAQEIDLLVKNLNLLDLNDFSPSVATRIHSALNHSGHNFYNWASMMMEHIAGSSNITFSEYRELCKLNPNLKEMVFKGTMLQPQAKEVTFSADNTPDVRIIDAVRASMSFPGAFEPWDVFKKTAKGWERFGIFTDGGVLNNFPITIFNDAVYENKHYPRVDTDIRTQAEKIARNPCSVGLALCSKLHKLNKDITPLTPRLEALLLDKNIKNSQQAKEESIEEELQQSGWHFSDMAQVLLKHKFGLNPEDPLAKYLAYSDQTVQIYTEGVDTLEFSLTPEKQRIIEASGYNAWMQWFKSRQDPSKTYPTANFDLDYFPKGANGRPLVIPSESETVAHFEKLFKDYMLIILEESLACQHNPLDAFKDPLNNQRLKFYSHLILEGIKVYQSKPGKTTIETVLEHAFHAAVTENAEKQRKHTEHRMLVGRIVNESGVLVELSKLISSKQIEDHQKALRIFKGKLSTVFMYLEESNADLLCLATASGDPVLLKGMLDQIFITDKMLTQTKRPLRYSIDDLLNETSDVSLYKYAMDSKNAAIIIPILLEAKVDPLIIDAQGRNAFHYAIEAGDIDALEALIAWCKKDSINIASVVFPPLNDTVGHYLVRNAPNSLLAALKQKPQLLTTLISDDATNQEGVTCVQLAAHLHYHDEVPHPATDLDDSNSLTANRLLCASKGRIEGSLSSFIDTQITLYNQNHERHARSVQDLMRTKESLIKISENEATLTAEISNLTADQCMSLLISTGEENKHLNFLIECALNPKYALIAKCLFTRISALTYSYSKMYDQTQYNKFFELLSTKYLHRSALYYAAIIDNPVMIEALRTFDVPVSSAGPIQNPNALTAAAKKGSLAAVEALISSKPRIPWVYESVERRLGDKNGKNVMHYLAKVDSPDVVKTMVIALSTGIANFYSISSTPDIFGHSPLFYLLQNKHAGFILEQLVKDLRKPIHEIFDLISMRENGYSDLEFAFKTNPVIANTLASLIPRERGSNEEVKFLKDARIKISAEEDADIISLPKYDAIKKQRALPIVRQFQEPRIIEDYDGVPFTPGHAKARAQLKEQRPSSSAALPVVAQEVKDDPIPKDRPRVDK